MASSSSASDVDLQGGERDGSSSAFALALSHLFFHPAVKLCPLDVSLAEGGGCLQQTASTRFGANSRSRRRNGGPVPISLQAKDMVLMPPKMRGSEPDFGSEG